jgi:hypothetical protein
MIMEVVRISEMSVNFYESTCHNIPQDSHPHNATEGQQIVVQKRTNKKPVSSTSSKMILW